jgi:hypothetical protein
MAMVTPYAFRAGWRQHPLNPLSDSGVEEDAM